MTWNHQGDSKGLRLKMRIQSLTASQDANSKFDSGVCEIKYRAMITTQLCRTPSPPKGKVGSDISECIEPREKSSARVTLDPPCFLPTLPSVGGRGSCAVCDDCAKIFFFANTGPLKMMLLCM